MRQIKLNEIAKDILTSQDVKDVDDFEYFLSEAQPTKALEFFNISYNKLTKTLTVPEAFDELNYDDALETVNSYFDKVDEGDPKDSDYSEEVNKYDAFTEPFRGADDGTFDYAGSFVIIILSIIAEHLARQDFN